MNSALSHFLQIFPKFEPKDFIPIISLAISFVALWTTNRDKKIDEARQVRDRLNDLTTKILDALSALELRMTELMKDARPETAMIAQRASSVTNDTIMALAGAMIELIRKYRRARPSVMEYWVLARSFSINRDPRAERYWKRADKLSPPGSVKISLQCGLAEYLFYGERLNDGRQKFEDALALIERVRDEKSFKCYTRGFTYQRWMIAEFCLGNNTVANEKFELAKSEFQQIAIIPLRAQLLASLHQAAGRPLFPSPSAS